jgi:hypothetical protein
MTAAWGHPDKPGTRDLSRLWWRVRDVGKRLGRFIDVPLNRILIIAGIISLIVTGAGGGLKLGLSFGSRERSVIVPWLCGRSRIHPRTPIWVLHMQRG